MKHQGHFSFLIDVEVDWFTESFVLSRIHDGWTTCSFLHRSISLMVTILTELISLVMSHFFSHFKELSLFGLCPVRVFNSHVFSL